jgi:hypothetical protein
MPLPTMNRRRWLTIGGGVSVAVAVLAAAAVPMGRPERAAAASRVERPSERGSAPGQVRASAGEAPLPSKAVTAAPSGAGEAAPVPRAEVASPTDPHGRTGPEPQAGGALPKGPASPVGSGNRLLSPLTADVVARLKKTASEVDRKDDVFAKVGDSATVNRAFMQCFSDAEDVDLAGRDHLEETVRFFRGGDAAYSDPYRRDSEAAKVGWSSRQVLSGRPAPLLREVRAISPRFALVMLGTNELERQNLRRYSLRMRRIVDALTSRGVIPILYTLPPRNDDPDADALVPRYNLVIEAVARGRKVPWIDLHAGMLRLPNRGIASDRLHPSAPVRGGKVRGCDLSTEGLRYGQNLRNLLTIRMLDRLRSLILEGEGSPAPGQMGPAGQGTAADPFQAGQAPFSLLASTKEAGSSQLSSYAGCDAEQNEGGPEQVHRFKVVEPGTVRVAALYDRDVDVDVHLLGDDVGGAACIARGDRALRAEVTPGTYHVVVDTFEGAKHAGEYLLVVDTPPDDDASDDEG